ncbi:MULTISPECIES: hypothetical protein [unclassified Streptomyces]|uniref:hypothetical protein n=1 Tax=unclassified Streptomyces TaxID=2593676 RepID=UPI000B50537E|nr:MULTISPECIES: hypothetical protein [unclassified Streptomyces]MYW99908.1 hypothetical protein [Streptomyces sp. SID8378]SNB89874.1 hypothetical protein SAMN02745831_06168 [Streptomyces sp. PgraA7]
MSIHLTEDRIAAALAAASQPEGETPWHLLLTRPPMTHTDVRMAIARRRNPELQELTGKDERTIRAEASRAEIIQGLARRDGYLAAMAAAEHILSTTPVLPVDVDVRLAEWNNGPTLVIGFHKDPDQVRAFASHFGTEVAELPHGEGRVRIETTGTMAGVRFEAYTLADAPAAAE